MKTENPSHQQAVEIRVFTGSTFHGNCTCNTALCSPHKASAPVHTIFCCASETKIGNTVSPHLKRQANTPTNAVSCKTLPVKSIAPDCSHDKNALEILQLLLISVCVFFFSSFFHLLTQNKRTKRNSQHSPWLPGVSSVPTEAAWPSPYEPKRRTINRQYSWGEVSIKRHAGTGRLDTRVRIPGTSTTAQQQPGKTPARNTEPGTPTPRSSPKDLGDGGGEAETRGLRRANVGVGNLLLRL